MSRRNIYSFVAFIALLLLTWVLSDEYKKNEEFSEKAKISLRGVGNQLLLSNQDSTSLVLPVIELNEAKYKLSFQNQLYFEPSSLVSIVESSFEKASLPANYIVEVIQCADQEVAYSYEMSVKEENTIISCAGRFLPKNCYTIEVRFTDGITFFSHIKTSLYILIFLIFLLLEYLFYKRKQTVKTEDTYAAIGSFKFYPEQNKLVKHAIEISLSKKECELLAIFVDNPNQIIKRDKLTKKVWEDNGVFVGRSLDTYISKLRKILKEDDSIKLINVHGVGYKLELKN